MPKEELLIRMRFGLISWKNFYLYGRYDELVVFTGNHNGLAEALRKEHILCVGFKCWVLDCTRLWFTLFEGINTRLYCLYAFVYWFTNV